MSHYNHKGMASDLSLGRPTSAGDTNNIAAAAAAAARQHTYMQQARDHKEFSDDADYNGTTIGGLECYVRALQGERDKLDAFRRELPICMSLLDDAIQASRVKLTKAVASSTMVACQASYSNYGNPTYASKGGVHSTPASDVQASRYSWGSAYCKPHAHASDHEHQPSALTHMSITPSNIAMFPSAHPPPPPHLAATPSHLHLINYAPSPTTSNMFLHKLQQKEATLFNQESAQLEMMRQSIKTEGFNTHEFSSSDNQEDDIREGKEYGGLVEEHVHDEEGASPRVMISNMPNNNINSAGGIMTSQTQRKARRCWSPELHQLFLHALHQLGGPQLATPKQIRELMHVEGLTNDEVKSHLQKFRLHTRRPAPIPTSEPAQQPHHLVLFGGIWVPTSPAESAPGAQVAACQLAGGGNIATSSGNHNPYVPFHHVINGQNTMQTLMSATSSDQLDVHAGMDTASEVDVARSDQSTSQNGGLDNTLHEDEDTEIHLGSKPIISREITSPIAKARYQ